MCLPLHMELKSTDGVARTAHLTEYLEVEGVARPQWFDQLCSFISSRVTCCHCSLLSLTSPPSHSDCFFFCLFSEVVRYAASLLSCPSAALYC